MIAKGLLFFYLTSCLLTQLIVGLRLDAMSIVCMFSLMGFTAYVISQSLKNVEPEEVLNGGDQP